MKYPKEYLDEIKNRLKVSTVVSKSVALKKRGRSFLFPLFFLFFSTLCEQEKNRDLQSQNKNLMV